MGLLDIVLQTLGYTKKTAITDHPFVASFLSGGSGYKNNPYETIPPVYKAIKAVIDNLAQCELMMVDREWSRTTQYGEVLSLFDSVLDESGRPIGFSELVQKMGGYYCLYGEVFFLRNADTVGEAAGIKLPKKLQILNPKYVSANISNQTLINWYYLGASYTTEQIICIKDFNPYNSIRSVSPIKVLVDQITMQYGASEYMANLFLNDATAGMTLETDKDLSSEQIDKLRTSWEARHRGPKNARKMAILDNGLKANQLGFNPNDMKFNEFSAKLEESIIGTWRVPKSMFGYTDNLNRATFLGQLNVFWTMMLIPILRKFESGLNSSIVTPYTAGRAYIAFDLSKIEALRENLDNIAPTVQILNQAGFTGNEINARLGLGFEDKPWRESWWIPFSQVPAGEYTDVKPTPSIDAPAKSIQTRAIVAENGLTYSEKAFKFAKNFNQIHALTQSKFTKGLKSYFNGQRKRVLDAFDSQKSFQTKAVQLSINWSNEKELYAEQMRKSYDMASQEGVKAGESVTGLTSSESLKYKLNNATTSRINKMGGLINDYTEQEVNKTISDGVDAGLSSDEIKQSIKQYYNQTDNRLGRIARTEVTAQLNGGLLLQYDDVGIEQKEWVTNIDGFERDAHAEANGQIVNLNDAFEVDGEALMAPGDGSGSPANTINCRCSCFPVMS